jgi:DNA repair protein RadD
MDFSACAVRGGDYANKEMNQLAQQSDNERLIDEVILKAGDRKAWLFFCSGVEHAQQVNDILNAKGIPSCCVTGKTPKKEREKIINQYKSGEYKALTNANVLTTGFDYPDIDLLVFLRPTLSARLYMQMAGRGMRLKSHTDHCLVMDFAGLIRKHGPVTDVKKPQQSKKGEAPIKVCEQCQEIVHLSAQFCPSCNFQFYEESQKPNYMLDDDNCIMGLDNLKTKAVSEWVWAEHVSKSSGNLMIKVSYYSGLSDRGVTEYFPVLNNSERGNKAVQAIYQIAEKSGANINCQDLKELADSLNDSKPPALIRYEKNGNLFNVILREWSNGKENNRNLGMASELSRATA